MSRRIKDVDRLTPMLLPPDFRDWVAEDDLVHVVIEAVDRLSVEVFELKNGAPGTSSIRRIGCWRCALTATPMGSSPPGESNERLIAMWRIAS